MAKLSSCVSVGSMYLMYWSKNIFVSYLRKYKFKKLKKELVVQYIV